MKIEQKITNAAVKSAESPTVEPLADRAEILTGATYKIKPGSSDHAMYITINDRGGIPYEIFINSKCSDSLVWLMTVTRMMSAVMRVTDNLQFLIDELKNIQDPKGSYFYKGLGHVPSVQAHIGIILERHIRGTT